MTFSVATKDALGNIDNGLRPNDAKWLQTTLNKHYQGMCYVEPNPKIEVVLLISISTKTDEVVPKVVDVPVYTLKIVRTHEGKSEVLRTFQRSKSSSRAGTVSGLANALNNPEHDVILDAVDWIANADVDLSSNP